LGASSAGSVFQNATAELPAICGSGASLASVARNNFRLLVCQWQIRLCGANHSVNRSACLEINERIVAIPECVCSGDNVTFPKRDYQIAIGVSLFGMGHADMHAVC
jgi:hypothetical protein